MKSFIWIFLLSFFLINQGLTAQNCKKAPSPQANMDERYMPLPTDPVKTLRFNLVFFHRPANNALGIKASKEREDEYQEFIDDSINFAKWQISDLLYENPDDECSDKRIDSRLRLDVKKVFINDTYAWNNENDDCKSGCPDLHNCDWYINYIDDSLNNGLANHQKRINIYFTEYQAAYEASQKKPVNKRDYPIGGDCSMSYRRAFDKDCKIHMRNEYIHYLSKKWYAKNNPEPWKTVRDWGEMAVARTLLHEIGHTIFGSGHVKNSCNLMNGGNTHAHQHIRKQQLIEAHQALSTQNMRKYVNVPTKLSHDYVVSNNEVIDYDLQLWGNIVVKKGAKLTLSCFLRMAPNAKIIVEQGAQLIVDGGIIEAAYQHGNYNWAGLEVEKPDSFFMRFFRPKKYAELSGKVTIINNGKIIY